MSTAAVVLVLLIALLLWRRGGQPKQHRLTRSSTDVVSDVSESSLTGFVRVENARFFGPVVTSPNGRYRFGWQDFDYRGGGRGGARENGNGQVLLLEGDQLRFRRDMDRPNDRSTSNVGIASVSDWLFDSGLCGVFYVLSVDGDILIAQHFSANLSNSGITPDGHLAWCTTAHSSTSDSAILAVFDTSVKAEILRCERPHGRVQLVQRDGPSIVLTTDEDVTYKYDRGGALLNPSEVQKAVEDSLIRGGSPWQLLSVVESRLERSTAQTSERERLLELLDRAWTAAPENRTRARVKRRRGEVLVTLGRTEEAVINLREALQLDEKVGAKRLLKKLQSSADREP